MKQLIFHFSPAVTAAVVVRFLLMDLIFVYVHYNLRQYKCCTWRLKQYGGSKMASPPPTLP
jgi:hypothetical protein